MKEQKCLIIRYIDPSPKRRGAIHKSFMNKGYITIVAHICYDCNSHSEPLGGSNSIDSSSLPINVLFSAMLLVQLGKIKWELQQVE